LRIADDLVGPALHEGHVHLPAQEPIEILDGARGAKEIHAEALAGKTGLVLAAEGVVDTVDLAGGHHDAARRKRIHEAHHPADDGDRAQGRHHEHREREPARQRRANSSFVAVSRAGSASRSSALRAISLAPASRPACAGARAAAAANSRVWMAVPSGAI